MVIHSRVLRARAVATLFAVALAIPAAAQSRTDKNLSNIHIDNFGKVNANYYRGAQPEGHDYADLAALGVKTVINLTSDDAEADEQGMAEAAGMRYVQIPMTTHEPPTAAMLAKFMDIVNNPASQPVYV